MRKAIARFVAVCSVFIFGIACPFAPGQRHPAAARTSDAGLPIKLPVHELEFKVAEEVTGIAAPQMAVVPAQCSSDGSLFLQMIKAVDPGKASQTIEQVFYSIRDKKGRLFSAGDISDLRNISVVSAFPSSTVVGLLVRATKATAESSSMSANSGARASPDAEKYHYYLAKFKIDGTYQDSVELPMNYPLFRVAILPSGEILTSGYDQMNHTARLTVLGPKGDVIREIDPLLALEGGAKVPNEFNSFDSNVASGRLLNSLFFTAYGERILAWHTGVGDSVLDIGEGGAVREVPIHSPKGYVVADMLPSTGRWVGHFKPADWNDEGEHDDSGFVYYELDPSDGAMTRRLSMGPGGPGMIACESDGTYVSYQIGPDKKLQRLTAD